MKKHLIQSLFLLLPLSILSSHAETLYWGSSGQKPLEVVTHAVQKDLPDGQAEGNQRTTLEQSKVICKAETTNCLPQTQVILTIDGLEDDSIKAIRYTFLLEQGINQPWRIIERKEHFSCRKNRGQNQFTDKKCL